MADKSELRKKAQEILKQRGSINTELYSQSLEQLVQELSIYQIELEQQNEELRITQDKLEAAKKRASDLYHHAPGAYFTLNEDNIILEANKTLATMLEVALNKLIGQNFTKYISPDSQDAFYFHVKKKIDKSKHNCNLRIRSASGKIYHICLETKRDDTSRDITLNTLVDISEQKRYQDQLKFHFDILKNVKESIIATNMLGEITYWNKGAEKIFGYTEKEMLGKKPSLLYPEKEEKEMAKDLESILEGTDYEGEWKGRTKEGKTIWVSIHTSLLYDKHENPIGFIGVASDITLEKHQQEIIEESEKKYRTIFSSAADAIFLIDGDIIDCNDAACRLFGYTRQTLIGKNPVDLSPKEQEHGQSSRELGLQHIKHALKHGEKMFSWKHQRKDKTLFDAEVNLSAYSTGDDRRLIATVRDVSERNRIFHLQERFSAIIKNSEDAIISKDLQGKIESWNRGAEKLYGYLENEVIGKRIQDIFKKNKLEINSHLKEIRKGKTVSNFQTTRYTKGGKRLHLALSLSPIHNKEGEIIGVGTIGRDITPQKEYELLLKKSEQRYKSIFRNNSSTMLVIDPESKVIIDCSNQATEFYGYPRNELIGKSISNINSSPPEEIAEKIQLSLESRKGYFEFVHQLADGSLRNVEVYSGPVEIDGKNMLYSIVHDTTEKTKIQKELLESEQRYRAIFDLSADGIFLVQDHKIVECNKRFLKIMGYEKEEDILGKKPYILSPEKQPDHKESAARGKEIVQEVLKKGYLRFTWTHQRKDGKNVETEIALTRFQLKGKTSILAVLHDISEIMHYQLKLKEKNEEIASQNEEYQVINEELNEMNQKLSETYAKMEISERKFRLAFKTSPDAVTINRLTDGVYVDINEGFTNITGFTTKDVIGKSSMDKSIDIWANPNDRKKLIESLQKKGYCHHLKAQFRKKNGAIIIGTMSASIIELEGIPHIISISRDITQVEKAREALIKSEERFRNLTAQLPIGIYRTNEKGDILYCNPSLVRILGFKSENEFKRININELFYKPNNRSEMLKTWIEEKVFVNEMEMKKKNGSKIWVRDTGRAVFDKNNKFLYFDGTLEDISSRKKAEKDLIKAKEKAEESDRLKSAFLANMSHEIRTPMNGIIGFTQLMLDKKLNEEKQKKYLQIIDNRSKHLLNIINDIIDISRIEANQMQINKELFHVNDLLFEIYDFYKTQVDREEKRVDIELDMPEKIQLSSDAIRIKQILTNLISNALKFTEEGYVRFGFARDKEFLKFYVKDTGLGIPNKALSNVFKRFRQVDDSSTRKFGGTGLGLSISKSLTELLGGEIGVESKEGEGSTFWFTIPLENEENDKPAGKSKMNGTPDLTGKTVLIVEDDPISRSFFQDLLEETDATIRTAENGENALKYLKGNPAPDMVLLDIQMPGISGYEVVKEIRKKYKDLPVVAQTAHALSSEKKKIAEAGFDDYITKPIDIKLLFSTLSKYLIKKQ